MIRKNPRVIPPPEIVAYLEAHPEFFARYPDLLERLELPHISSRNVASLLAYQVQGLRRELDDLRHQLAREAQKAVSQRQLGHDMHALVLALLQAQNAAGVMQALRRALQDLYDADQLRLLIFAHTREALPVADVRVLEPASALGRMFTELYRRGKPLCGSLQEEHLQALFGAAAGSIRSTVLLPRVTAQHTQLLALGSCQAGRYGLGPELDLLEFLNTLLGVIVNKSFWGKE